MSSILVSTGIRYGQGLDHFEYFGSVVDLSFGLPSATSRNSTKEQINRRTKRLFTIERYYIAIKEINTPLGFLMLRVSGG